MVPRLFLAAAALALAWGAFAFGAVYDWAFRPLAVALALVGLGCLAVARRGPALGSLAVALGAVAIATSLQLVPLPDHVLSTISPGTVSFLSQYDLSYVAAHTPDPQAASEAVAIPRRPISIAPDSTLVALGLFVALSLFALGVARLVSVTGIRPAAWMLVCLGLALAAVGIGQDLILGHFAHIPVYGFWETQTGTAAFGPFVNRNHFAGWMVMVIPLAMALLVDDIDRAVPLSRVARLSDLMAPQASSGGRGIMGGAICVVMAMSVAMTESRSGIVALLGGCAVFMAHLVRRRRGSMGATVLVGAILVVALLALGGAGLESAFGRFVSTNEKSTTLNIASAGGRIGIWSSTARMAAASPLTGFGLNSYGTGTILFQEGPRREHWREAHNDYLQLAAEGGLLVCIPIAAAAVVFAQQVRRRFHEAPRHGTTYWLRVGAVVGLLSIAAQAVFEFSLQMPGNAALFAMLVGMALHQSPSLRRS